MTNKFKDILPLTSPMSSKPNNSKSLYIHADNELIQYVATSSIVKNEFHMITLFDDEFIKNYALEMSRNVINSGF